MRARSGHFGQDVTMTDPALSREIVDAEQCEMMIPAEFEDSYRTLTVQEMAEGDSLDFKAQIAGEVTEAALQDKVDEEVQKKKLQRYALWGALGIFALRRYL